MRRRFGTYELHKSFAEGRSHDCPERRIGAVGDKSTLNSLCHSPSLPLVVLVVLREVGGQP